MPQKDGNDLYEHRKSIKKFYDERFAKPLAEALKRPATTSKTSPVAEVLTDLSASDVMQSSSTRLMVFSDMMQNSDNVSLYGCRDGLSAIAEYMIGKADSQADCADRSTKVRRPTFRPTNRPEENSL